MLGRFAVSLTHARVGGRDGIDRTTSGDGIDIERLNVEFNKSFLCLQKIVLNDCRIRR